MAKPACAPAPPAPGNTVVTDMVTGRRPLPALMTVGPPRVEDSVAGAPVTASGWSGGRSLMTDVVGCTTVIEVPRGRSGAGSAPGARARRWDS